MQQAGLKAAAGKTADAAAIYDDAAKAAPNKVLADFATLRAGQLLLGTASLADEQARLGPLTEKDRPFAPYAKEALAMAKLVAGQTEAARSDCNLISVSFGASEDLRQRCQLMIALIDAGEAKTAVAAAKAAATLPPPAAASLPPPPQSPEGPPSQGPAGAPPAAPGASQ
jgi:hypothetical protein